MFSVRVGHGSVYEGEASVEALCISSSDMTSALGLEWADKMLGLSSPRCLLDLSLCSVALPGRVLRQLLYLSIFRKGVDFTVMGCDAFPE